MTVELEKKYFKDMTEAQYIARYGLDKYGGQFGSTIIGVGGALGWVTTFTVVKNMSGPDNSKYETVNNSLDASKASIKNLEQAQEQLEAVDLQGLADEVDLVKDQIVAEVGIQEANLPPHKSELLVNASAFSGALILGGLAAYGSGRLAGAAHRVLTDRFHGKA
jgi:hypothetical protein